MNNAPFESHVWTICYQLPGTFQLGRAQLEVCLCSTNYLTTIYVYIYIYIYIYVYVHMYMYVYICGGSQYGTEWVIISDTYDTMIYYIIVSYVELTRRCLKTSSEFSRWCISVNICQGDIQLPPCLYIEAWHPPQYVLTTNTIICLSGDV